MTKDQVFGVVKKHLTQTLDDVNAADVQPAKSMKDLGASSLDLVEIVSLSMRELKVKVPRSELSKLNNIGGLVDLLHQAALEKSNV